MKRLVNSKSSRSKRSTYQQYPQPSPRTPFQGRKSAHSMPFGAADRLEKLTTEYSSLTDLNSTSTDMNERSSQVVTFPVSTSLRKAIALPHQRQWRVHEGDVALTSSVVCYLKSKGFFFEYLSSIRARPATLTQQGFLIIYETEETGFVLDMRIAKVINSKTERIEKRKASYRRCHMKLKYPFGTVHLFFVNDDIAKWRSALHVAHEGNKERINGKTEEKATQCENMVEAHSESSSVSLMTSVAAEATCDSAEYEEVSVEMPDSDTTMTEKFIAGRPCTFVPPITLLPPIEHKSSHEKSNISSRFDTTLCDEPYQWMTTTNRQHDTILEESLLSTNSGLLTEIETETNKEESVKSVRCGYLTVAMLKKRLEAKMRGTFGKKNEAVIQIPPPRKAILPQKFKADIVTHSNAKTIHEVRFAPPLPVNPRPSAITPNHKYSIVIRSTSSLVSPNSLISSPVSTKDSQITVVSGRSCSEITSPLLGESYSTIQPARSVRRNHSWVSAVPSISEPSIVSVLPPRSPLVRSASAADSIEKCNAYQWWNRSYRV